MNPVRNRAQTTMEHQENSTSGASAISNGVKLLIVTQAVDTEDPVLGFFVRWIEEFAKHAEQIQVICLKEGKHESLPANVRVHSLGKEKDPPRFARRLRYAIRFKMLAWCLRNDYDTVFVHMNSEYVVLAGILWRFLGKKVLLWRNHPKGDWMANLAVGLSHAVYATSSLSYVYTRFPGKTRLMPVGIDTDQFVADTTIVRNSCSILFFGRISPVKRVDVFLKAVALLKERGVACEVHIIGSPHNPGDEEYHASLRSFVETNGLSKMVTWAPSIPHYEVSKLFSEHAILVNLTTTGSFDKTIFEAMSCGMLIATTNGALRGEIPGPFLAENTEEGVARCLQGLLAMPVEERRASAAVLREFVVQRHSLKDLAKKIFL